MDAVEGMANTVSNNKRHDGAAGGKELCSQQIVVISVDGAKIPATTDTMRTHSSSVGLPLALVAMPHL